jgi:hypothetical protein
MILSVIILMVFSSLNNDNVTLNDLRWKNRVVIFFQGQGQKETKDIDSLKSELEERKIVFLAIGDTFTTNSEYKFSQKFIRSLKEKYALKNSDGNWLLIGLDGGVKLKSEDSLDWDLVFRTVEAMPMRQSEIKKKDG